MSFGLAIQVKADAAFDTDLNACRAAEAFAGGAVRRIADPGQVSADPAVPLGNWAGCALLVAALGQERQNWTVEVDDNTGSIDGCRARAQGQGRSCHAGAGSRQRHRSDRHRAGDEQTGR